MNREFKIIKLDLDLVGNLREAIGQLFIILSILFFGDLLLLLSRKFSNFLTNFWIIFIILLLFFILGYVYKWNLLIIAGILLAPIWWGFHSSAWIENKRINFNSVYSGLMLILIIYYLFGRLHEVSKRWKSVGSIYTMFSILFLFCILFLFSTQSGLYFFEKKSWEGILLFNSSPFLFLICFFLLSLILFYMVIRTKRNLINIELFFLYFLFIFSSIFNFILPSNLMENYTPTKIGIIWLIFFNILCFLYLIWLLIVGYFRKDENFVNIGVFFMFVFIITKYFSFFKFLNKSIFFFIGGIVFFVIGYLLEKGRRTYLKKLVEGKDEK